MNIQLIADRRSLDATKLMLANMGGIYSKVVSRAINRSLTSVRARAVGEIYLKLNLTQRKIRESFTFDRATISNPSGAVRSAGKPVPLIDFSGTRALARGGVSVQVKRGEARIRLLHAFIATMRSGHRGVFEREAGNFGRPFQILKNYAAMPKRFRLPIDELFSLRITDEYAKPVLLNTVTEHAGETYQNNIEHELDYELGLL